jgi:hypothetical protein
MGTNPSSLSVESIPELDLGSAAQVWVTEFTSPEVLKVVAERFDKLFLARILIGSHCNVHPSRAATGGNRVSPFRPFDSPHIARQRLFPIASLFELFFAAVQTVAGIDWSETRLRCYCARADRP